MYNCASDSLYNPLLNPPYYACMESRTLLKPDLTTQLTYHFHRRITRMHTINKRSSCWVILFPYSRVSPSAPDTMDPASNKVAPTADQKQD